MFNEKQITAALHANGVMGAMCAVAISASLAAVMADGDPYPFGIAGVASPWSQALGVVANLATVLLIVYINKAFNILRSPTKLCAGMFMVMQMAVPAVCCDISWGLLLAPLMLFVAIRLFASFNDQHSQRSVYTVFFSLACAMMVHRCFGFFMVVALMGCAQMRILTFKTFLAALLGAVTPLWLLLGFGMIDASTIRWPGMSLAWRGEFTAEALQAVVAASFTFVAGLTFTILNLLKILSYNARVRAFNGFLTLLFVATGIVMAVDFVNFPLYLPLLNCMAAYQLSHFFTYRRSRRAYVPILLFVVAYFSLYYWSL